MTDNEIIKALKRIAQYSGFTDDVSNTLLSALDLINRKKARIEKIKKKLQYYLNINEENGVVYIPKFVVDNLVKEMTEVDK